jgi:hypothetical protein
MIIFGIAAQQSVPKLFLAGIVPGLLIGVLVSIYLLIYARVEMIPLTAALRWRNVLASTRDAVWALFAPVVILGGIYGGIFTPTEAAGIACVYAILVARFIYHEMSWIDLWQTAIDSARVISQILIIVSAAGAYSWLVTTSGFPARLVGAIASLHLETWLLLLIINVVLLFVGTVPEPPAAILILTPLLMPLIIQAGVDQIHFRHHLHRQPGGRNVHTAVRAQSLRHPRAVRHPAQALPWHFALHRDLSHRAGADHLHSRDHAGAAAVVAVRRDACCVAQWLHYTIKLQQQQNRMPGRAPCAHFV